ncbi:50S ribosomal protein L24 [Spirochaeta lutea]|uniref:Large ribosomal subunit protein uL24 n=1 Tax=Spirochaeta lutea TaxID=1480694 RepID=A0A098QSD8_9SPIO|nr:50S ribosomal protein L24 [Spirochaeta lutea]KGE70679.1 50S ribosomal protein L24 [Spirochaeta lutea]
MQNKTTVNTKLKKNDLVMVVSGKEKGKTGRILKLDLNKGRVIVEGVNMVKKAVRRKDQNDRGGIMEIEGSIHISNVMAVDKSGKPTRLTFTLDNGKKVRTSVRTGEAL